MLAVYDLAVSPPTYDFASFLISAERRRIEKGLPGFRVAVVPGPAGGFRSDSLPPPLEMRRRMLAQVVLPMVRLVPACTGVDIVDRGDLAAGPDVFPDRYTPEKPVSHYGAGHYVDACRAGVFPFEVPAALGDPDLVTITLRECDYWPSRNSNLAAWLDVARWLRERGRRPVFVRDAAKAGEDLPGFACDRVAAVDLVERARLYACAGLNIGVNNGPMWVATAMPRAATMIFKMIVPDCPASTESHLTACGLPIGAQIGRPAHTIVYETDAADVIVPMLEREKSLWIDFS